MGGLMDIPRQAWQQHTRSQSGGLWECYSPAHTRPPEGPSVQLEDRDMPTLEGFLVRIAMQKGD